MARNKVATHSWFERLGLSFDDPAQEDAFARTYVQSTWRLAQIFLLIGGTFYYIFFLWDRLIDPDGSGIAHAIRGFIVTPVLVSSAALLFTEFGRRHLEALLVACYMVGQLGLVTIYSSLDRGFDYAAVGLIILFMGMTSAMTMRTRYVAIACAVLLSTTYFGHVGANNAQPGWLFINMLAMGNAAFFGLLASYLRERGARRQFITDQALDGARRRIEDLLHSILPRDIAQRIQAGESSIAESLGEVSIVFVDMVGFTKHARNASPKQLTEVLNILFSAFDREAERYGIDKIKTIGDAYMAIGGLDRSEAARDHAENAANFALAVQRVVSELAPTLPWPIAVRIGLHVGPVVAGVIGSQRPAFDCWGEAVNLAARLERQAPPGTILISGSAYWRLRRNFETIEFQTLDLKGIGETAAYSLGPRRSDALTLRVDANALSMARQAGTTIAAPPGPGQFDGFVDPNTPGYPLWQRILARFKLLFKDPELEEQFTEGFTRGSIRTFQALIVLGALSFAAFYSWDEIVDLKNSHIAISIRVFFVLPLLTLISALLFLPWFRRHVESLSVTGFTIIQFAQAWIYNVLDHGFDYVAMGFVLIMMAMTTAFPLRAKFLMMCSVITFVIMLAGHLIADNARPGWLIINIFAVTSGVIFGVLAACFREQALRVQFLTDRELTASRERADSLLQSILPADTVRRIQSGETAIADALDDVSIVFADLAGFTALSRQLSPPDLINLLNTLFSRFDALALEHGLVRIKTIGDAYIAVGGMERSRQGEDHAANAARFAIAMRDAARALMRETDYPINIRIGVHTGPVVAGVIGVRRPTFDCWGDTVVFASGLESSARPGSILVSDRVAQTLDAQFAIEAANDVTIGDAPPARVWELTGERAAR